MLETLEQSFPMAIRPKQLRALAMARRGEGDDLMKAQEILGSLYELGERDPETLGIYARTWMDRYEKSGDMQDLKQSRDLYVEAFDGAQDDYYTGINAAAKSVFLGTDLDLKRAAKYAERVQQIVGTQPHPNDYWETATVAETFLVQKQYAQAGALYEAAVSMARAEVGSHQSTWKQARRLLDHLQPTEEERALMATFRAPEVNIGSHRDGGRSPAAARVAKAEFTQPEWAAAFAQDPTGEKSATRGSLYSPWTLLKLIIYVDPVQFAVNVAAGDPIR